MTFNKGDRVVYLAVLDHSDPKLAGKLGTILGKSTFYDERVSVKMDSGHFFGSCRTGNLSPYFEDTGDLEDDL